MKKSTAVDASHHHHYNNNIATTTYYYIYENTILYIGASVWPKQKKTVCRKCEHFFFFCLDFYLPKKDEDEKTKVVWGKSECAPFSAAAAAESAADPYLRRRPHIVVQRPSPSHKLAVPFFFVRNYHPSRLEISPLSKSRGLVSLPSTAQEGPTSKLAFL